MSRWTRALLAWLARLQPGAGETPRHAVTPPPGTWGARGRAGGCVVVTSCHPAPLPRAERELGSTHRLAPGSEAVGTHHRQGCAQLRCLSR